MQIVNIKINITSAKQQLQRNVEIMANTNQGRNILLYDCSNYD